MDTLFEILQSINDEVDYRTCETLIDDEIFDSFDIISLVARLNEAYDIEIGAEELTPEHFNSASAIFSLVTRIAEE